jgi:hypothetical protein
MPRIIHASPPSAVHTANESVATNKIRNSSLTNVASKEYEVAVFIEKFLVVLINLSFLIKNKNFSGQFAGK